LFMNCASSSGFPAIQTLHKPITFREPDQYTVLEESSPTGTL
jgi:hypothetical protein